MQGDGKVMDMFCYQCQETSKNEGCTVVGVCGKTPEVANLQDLLIYVLKGISVYSEKAKQLGINDAETGLFVAKYLFSTITNVNFDPVYFENKIKESLVVREEVKANFLAAYKEKHGVDFNEELPEMATWYSDNVEDFYTKASTVGVLATENEDVRSLRELLTYGLKGISAYIEHAFVLNEQNAEVFSFLQKGLAATTDDTLSADDLVGVIMDAGGIAVKAMEMLDRANTNAYGHPEPTQINIGVGNRPGILISGHDLKDLEELLEQSKDKGVDVYTHGEMLPANAYPFFKKYDHFVGNYGNSWWEQNREFESFNGPVLMTTNCLVPPKGSYQHRVYTTGVVGFPGLNHIEDRKAGEQKDFSRIIEHASTCQPPTEIENGTIPGGFARNAVLSVADKVVDAVQTGAINQFVVMAGCEGRHKTRDYYKDIARELPNDAVVLTAGCAKYRYNKLDLGDIGGIPRILDAGQCNDSYSLVVIAQKLVEALGVEDINDLPLSYDIAWYEQKAVAVLLALLHLGVKGIRLGPTLPAFISPNVLKVLVEQFDIKPIGTVKDDLEAIMAGK